MRTQVQLVGYLGQDPASKDVGDSSVCSFSVAVNRKIKGDDHTDWFQINAWGKLGDLCNQYLAKGRQVVVAGTLEPRAYETSSGESRMSLDVRANEVQFLSSDDNRGSRKGSDDSKVDEAHAARVAAVDDESIPFLWDECPSYEQRREHVSRW
jgi:single-strand DNA-binding protein